MLQKFLQQKGLVHKVLTLDELYQRAKDSDDITLVMGQTFDRGQPIDMMKYALFIMDLEDILRKQGVQTKSKWVIADHFVVNLNEDMSAQEAHQHVKQRINYLDLLNKVYGGDIEIVCSSQMSERPEYRDHLLRLQQKTQDNPKLKGLLLQTIPPEKRGNPHAAEYPLEELTTIQTLGADVKIGPPYEIVYDHPAREFSQEIGFHRYVAVHLTPSFLFGQPSVPADIRKEIECFGILPYKKHSKDLGDYRIDPIHDSQRKVQALINHTNDVRALLDLLVISHQARQRLKKEDPISFFAQKFNYMKDPEHLFHSEDPEITKAQYVDTLKDLALGSYKKYIEEPLNNET